MIVKEHWKTEDWFREIENYYIDEKNYSDLPINMKCENFSLDIKLICISEDLIKDLERILKIIRFQSKKLSVQAM